MSDRRTTAPPGTVLVIAILATAVAWIGWSRLRQVPIAPGPNDPVQPEPWPDMRIDVNTATAAELNALPGIGPRLAARIVADRDDGGRFVKIDDLQRVPGIGPRLVERVEPFVIAD